MQNIILALIIGVLIGVVLHKKNKVVKEVDQLITWSVWLLLLLLGITVGENDSVVTNFGALGIQAAVVTFFSVGFSLVFAYLLSVTVLKNEK